MTVQNKTPEPDITDGGDVRAAEFGAHGVASRLVAFAPIVLGVLLVVVFSLVWRQVWHPFIEHDDWDSLLPVDHARVILMRGRVLSEGRWLNYAWWLALGHSFSTVGAALLYEASFLAFAVGVAWRWAPGWLGLPVVVAMFASPMLALTSYWPATLAPSILVAALAVWTLPVCCRSQKRLAAWIFAATALEFLAYPPLALVLFLVLVAELIDESWRRVIAAAVLFGVSYVAAALIVFTLNLHTFGKFGLVVRPWRHPNPVHNLHSLWVNIKRYLLQLDRLASITTLPIVLGLCAIAVCLALPALRRRAIRLLLAVIIVMGAEGGTTILTGVTTPYRGSPWVWVALVIPLVWLIRDRPRPQAHRVVAVVAVLALVTVGLFGIRSWRKAIDYNQNRLSIYTQVERQLDRAVKRDPTDTVLIYGDSTDWTRATFTQEGIYLSQRALYAYGITTRNCIPPACDVPERPDVASQLERGAQVIRTSGFILVVPPSHVHLHPSYQGLGSR